MNPAKPTDMKSYWRQIEVAVSRITLYELAPNVTEAKCEPGAGQRALAAFWYALGLMGEKKAALNLASIIDRMHVDGEDLYIVCFRPFEAAEDEMSPEEENLRQGWSEVAGGDAERVHLVAPDSTAWLQIAKRLGA